MKTVAAIVVIGIIEAVALLQGIDGVMLSLAIAAIAGLGGYSLSEVLPLFKK